MLEMAQVEYIRYLRNKEGLSIAEIARRVQVSWPTAKKYADADCIEYQKGPKKKRVAPVMGPYMEVVDAWLQEDERVNKKQRRTAKMIYEQLCKDAMIELCAREGSAASVAEHLGTSRSTLYKWKKGTAC